MYDVKIPEEELKFMETITLYHGCGGELIGPPAVDSEIFKKDSDRTDFGKAFYLTPDYDFAELSAAGAVSQYNSSISKYAKKMAESGFPLKAKEVLKYLESEPRVYEYTFNIEQFANLNYPSYEFKLDLDWVMFVAYNRKKYSQYLDPQLNIVCRYNNIINDNSLIMGPSSNDKSYTALNNFFTDLDHDSYFFPHLDVESLLYCIGNIDPAVQYAINKDFVLPLLTLQSEHRLGNKMTYLTQERNTRKEEANRKGNEAIEYIKHNSCIDGRLTFSNIVKIISDCNYDINDICNDYKYWEEQIKQNFPDFSDNQR